MHCSEDGSEAKSDCPARPLATFPRESLALTHRSVRFLRCGGNPTTAPTGRSVFRPSGLPKDTPTGGRPGFGPTAGSSTRRVEPMASPHTGTPHRAYRRLAVWAGLSVGWLLPSAGCQVEYAGMTLPSGKYMHDDVQYFPPGPNFPWANTQAATQRARMQAMGIEAPPPETGADRRRQRARGDQPDPESDGPPHRRQRQPAQRRAAAPARRRPAGCPRAGWNPRTGSRACRTRSRLPARRTGAAVSHAKQECPGRHSPSNGDATSDPTPPSGSGVAFASSRCP